MNQYVSSLRYVANDFELFTDQLSYASKQSKNIIEKINSLKNQINATEQSKICSDFHELNRHLSVMTPNYILEYFKHFQVFFSLGNNFFIDNSIISAIEKTTEEVYIFITWEYMNYSGKTIKEILLSENRTCEQVPRVIENMNSYLYSKGPFVHGIFHESPNASVKQINEIYMNMSVTDFSEIPCDVIANVLKKFLRELSAYIFDRETSVRCFEQWTITNALTNEPQEIIKDIKPIILSLPNEHLIFFKMILKTAYKIASHSHINSMNSKNLSVCLSTNMMTFSDSTNIPINGDPNNEYSHCIDFITFCISNFPTLFPEDADTNAIRRSTFVGDAKCHKSSKYTYSTPSQSISETKDTPELPEHIVENDSDVNIVNDTVDDKTIPAEDFTKELVVSVEQEVQIDSQNYNDQSTTLNEPNIINTSPKDDISDPILDSLPAQNDNEVPSSTISIKIDNNENSNEEILTEETNPVNISKKIVVSTVTPPSTQPPSNQTAPKSPRIILGSRLPRQQQPPQSKNLDNSLVQQTNEEPLSEEKPNTNGFTQQKRPVSFIPRNSDKVATRQFLSCSRTNKQNKEKDDLDNEKEKVELGVQQAVLIPQLPQICMEPKKKGVSSSRATARFMRIQENETKEVEKKKEDMSIEELLLGSPIQTKSTYDDFNNVASRACDKEKQDHFKQTKQREDEQKTDIFHENSLNEIVKDDLVKVVMNNAAEEGDFSAENPNYD
ncbi:T-cell activation Rho GTPase activating protein [Entamoeba marina]